jgi:ribosomal protein L39E
MTEHVSPKAFKETANRRLPAWCRILDAIAEMRDALDHRLWREDIGDTQLKTDVQTWCELTQALADFLDVRRAA